jgi:ribose transport system permease protein
MSTVNADPKSGEVPQATEDLVSRLGAAFGFRRFSLVYVGIAIIALYSILTPDTFLTTQTLQSVLSEQAITAIVALGLLVPLSAGAYDLSVGYMLGFAGVLCGWLLTHGVPVVPCIAIVLVVGLIVGVANSTVVIAFRIDSFIGTLATGSILLALVGWVSGNSLTFGLPKAFTSIALTKLFGVSLPFFYLIVLAVILWFVLDQTPVGRRIYATGGSPEAASLAGIRTKRVLFGSLLVSAVCSALAGILLSANLAAASPTVGAEYLLPAFAASFLGSTQVTPGRFNVWGTLLAVYVLAIGVKGLYLLGAATWVPSLFNGVALILAVGLSNVPQGHLRRMRTGAMQRLRRRPA